MRAMPYYQFVFFAGSHLLVNAFHTESMVYFGVKADFNPASVKLPELAGL